MILAFPLTRSLVIDDDGEKGEQVRAAPPVVVDDENQLGAGEFLIFEGTKATVDGVDLIGGLSKGFSFAHLADRT